MTEDRVYQSQDLFDDYGKLNHHAAVYEPPSGSKAGTPDLITGATGECQKPTGEKFSPPKEEQNEEYSKNNKNNNNLENDRRKNPGAENTIGPLCTPLSPRRFSPVR